MFVHRVNANWRIGQISIHRGAADSAQEASTLPLVDSHAASPLIREMVQLRRMLLGTLGKSKTKGPAFGSVSSSAAVMLMPLTFLLMRSQICDSLGMRAGELSLMSIR